MSNTQVNSATTCFGIGTYQPLGGSQTLIVDGGFTIGPSQVSNPYAGLYGGTYGFLVDTRIRQPVQTQWTPAGEVGLDSLGNSVVRGYPQLSWTYTVMRPDYWYYLNYLYRQAARTPTGVQYTVLLQYPNPDGTDTVVRALAKMEPPTSSNRTVGAYSGVALHFTYVGQSQLIPGTPIVVI